MADQFQTLVLYSVENFQVLINKYAQSNEQPVSGVQPVYGLAIQTWKSIWLWYLVFFNQFFQPA